MKEESKVDEVKQVEQDNQEDSEEYGNLLEDEERTKEVQFSVAALDVQDKVNIDSGQVDQSNESEQLEVPKEPEQP